MEQSSVVLSGAWASESSLTSQGSTAFPQTGLDDEAVRHLPNRAHPMGGGRGGFQTKQSRDWITGDVSVNSLVF